MRNIVVFTDGASKGNPGPGGWGALILEDENVIELGGRALHTTNNKMELTGPIKALEKLRRSDEKIIVYTDSKYVINGITTWIINWKKNGWKTGLKGKVLNDSLWKKLDELSENKRIEWKYVPGHSGIPGNERVDQIASDFAQNKKVKLYKGDKKKYSISFDTSESFVEYKKVEPYYLVLTNGKLSRFTSWNECKKEVEGKSGRKFKKIRSKKEEEDTLKSWGL